MFLCKNIQKHLMRRKIACNHEWKMRSLAMNQTIAVNAHDYTLLCGEIRRNYSNEIFQFHSLISVHCNLSRGRVARFWADHIKDVNFIQRIWDLNKIFIMRLTVCKYGNEMNLKLHERITQKKLIYRRKTFFIKSQVVLELKLIFLK